MKIYHLQRDFSMSYAAWKKYIYGNYSNVTLIMSVGNGLYIVFAD